MPSRSMEQVMLVPVPEHITKGTTVTLICGGCRVQATLPRVGMEGQYVDINPATGWELYPRHLCPKCLGRDGGGEQ